VKVLAIFKEAPHLFSL